MIRINLLGRPRPKVKRQVAIAGRLQLILFVIPVSLAILVLTIHHSMIKGDIEDLNQQIAEKNREKQQMAQLQQEIQAFETDQSLLRGRIEVIEELKRNQAGPVRMLEAIGNTVSITETLWLTSMGEQAGGKIEFKGLAGSMSAVADFITNLSQSGVFSNVELQESVQRPDSEGSISFEFTLTADFALPASSEASADSQAAAAGGS
jgi:Tfp pilus assembly protein PilN